MGRQDRRISLRRRRDGQLYVGDGVRKQSDARLSLRDYSPVCVRHQCYDGDNIADKKLVRRIETLADELVRFTKALRT